MNRIGHYRFYLPDDGQTLNGIIFLHGFFSGKAPHSHDFYEDNLQYTFEAP